MRYTGETTLSLTGVPDDTINSLYGEDLRSKAQITQSSEDWGIYIHLRVRFRNAHFLSGVYVYVRAGAGGPCRA